MEIGRGVWLDARGAVWLEAERALLVADVHLGYVWVERQRGALLPLVAEDGITRLKELAEEYDPARFCLLGDTVHATAHNEVVEGLLAELLETVGSRWTLEFILGNHDVHLPAMLRRLGSERTGSRRESCGPHVLVHGDGVSWAEVSPALGEGGWVFSGHEHPAIRLGDGVATGVKVPCFLVGERRVVLPAFSRWSAGQVLGRQTPLSPLVEAESVRRVVAVMGNRLLPIPWGRGAGDGSS